MKIQRLAVLTRTVEFPFAFWVLWAAILLDGLGKFVVTFLGLYLVKDRQFSIEQTTLIISSFGLTSIPSAMSGGILSDKLGHRNTVILGFCLAAVAITCLGLARQFETIVIAAMAMGLLHRLNKPAITALVAEIIPAENRKWAYHLNYWANNLGAVFAMPVAGLLASMNYSLLFIGDALTAFGAALLLGLFFKNTVSLPTNIKRQTPSSQPITIQSDHLLWIIAFGVFLFATIYAQIDLALPLDMGQKGISEASFGTILAINPLVIVLFQVPFAQFVNCFTHSTLLSSGALLLGFGFALHSLTLTPLGYVLPVIVWTIGEMLFFPNALALITEITPPSCRARYQGIFYTAWGSLRFVGTSLGGIILAHWNTSILWIACLAIGLITAALFLLLRPIIQSRVT